MTDPVATIISVGALAVSGITAWLTLFRRGTIHMTKPTVVFFGPDGGPKGNVPAKPKVFLRSLVYCTGKRGHIIESMFVTLRRGETRQTFNIWVYGDKELARGSGLFVGDTGIVCNHHFLQPDDGADFKFLAGEYQVDVFASIVGFSETIHLSQIMLVIPEGAGSQLQDPEYGIYFDWGPDSKHYHPHVEKKKLPRAPDFLTEMFG